MEKREVLWDRVIKSKYGEDEGGWRSCGVEGAHGFGVWKTIRMD